MQTLSVAADGTTVIEFSPAEGRALRNKLLDLPGSPAAHQLQRLLATVHGEAYALPASDTYAGHHEHCYVRDGVHCSCGRWAAATTESKARR